MSLRSAVRSENAPPPMNGLLSQAIVANGFVFTSGVVASDPKSGEVIEGDAQAQFVSTQDQSIGFLCFFSSRTYLQRIYLAN